MDNNDTNYNKVFDEEADNVTEESSKQTAQDAQEKINDMDNDPPSALETLWRDIKLMASMLRDYWDGKYTTLAWSTVVAISIALAYFISPIDAIPDIIPVAGFLDDAVILRIAMQFVSLELDQYRTFKKIKYLEN